MRYGILRITVGGHVPDPILARDLQSVPLTPFGRSVLGGQTPAPAADSGIVGRVLVVRRRSRDGTDGTSGL